MMRESRNFSDQSGVSLVEALVAVALIGVITAVALTGFLGASATARANHKLTVGAALEQHLLARFNQLEVENIGFPAATGTVQLPLMIDGTEVVEPVAIPEVTDEWVEGLWDPQKGFGVIGADHPYYSLFFPDDHRTYEAFIFVTTPQEGQARVTVVTGWVEPRSGQEVDVQGCVEQQVVVGQTCLVQTLVRTTVQPSSFVDTVCDTSNPVCGFFVTQGRVLVSAGGAMVQDRDVEFWLRTSAPVVAGSFNTVISPARGGSGGVVNVTDRFEWVDVGGDGQLWMLVVPADVVDGTVGGVHTGVLRPGSYTVSTVFDVVGGPTGVHASTVASWSASGVSEQPVELVSLTRAGGCGWYVQVRGVSVVGDQFGGDVIRMIGGTAIGSLTGFSVDDSGVGVGDWTVTLPSRPGMCEPADILYSRAADQTVTVIPVNTVG